MFGTGPSLFTGLSRRWIEKSFDELLVTLTGWLNQDTDRELLRKQTVAQVAYCICADGTFFTDRLLDQDVQWHVHSFGEGIRRVRAGASI